MEFWGRGDTAPNYCMRLLSRAIMTKANLFIATTTDPASVNIYSHLMKNFVWSELSSSGHERKIFKSVPVDHPPVYLWMVHEPTIHINYPDVKFLQDFVAQGAEECPPSLQEILFLSKHAAKSGTVSLTVHPVGIPWLDDASSAGGIPGRCTPPSTHIGPLYRAVNIATKARGLDAVFQTSLEATHHGPYCDIPCCYVEIGSSENEWSNEDAGDVWSTCLGAHFNLPVAGAPEVGAAELKVQEDKDCTLKPENKLALVLIGGGHYVPRMADLVLYLDLYLLTSPLTLVSNL